MNGSFSRGLVASLILINLMTLLTLSLLVWPRPVAALPPLITYKAKVAKKQKPQMAPAIVGQPNRLVVGDLGIDLVVGTGSYDEVAGDWLTSYSAALHADTSMPINDSNGVTLIYAHALPGLFGPLSLAQPDMLAEVYVENGYRFTYRYTESSQVDPTDTSIFQADGPPTLVLQTCTGPWDAYRSLYRFELVSAERIG